MSKTLLEKAKNEPVRKSKEIGVTDEDIELFLAFIRGDVNMAQCIKAKEFARTNTGGFYVLFVRTILVAYQKGLIKIK